MLDNSFRYQRDDDDNGDDVGDDGESESERGSESHALTRVGWCLGGVGVWALDFPNV